MQERRYPRRSLSILPSKDIRFHPKSGDIEGRDSINAAAEIDLEDFHGPFARDSVDRGQGAYRCSCLLFCVTWSITHR